MGAFLCEETAADVVWCYLSLNNVCVCVCISVRRVCCCSHMAVSEYSPDVTACVHLVVNCGLERLEKQKQCFC